MDLGSILSDTWHRFQGEHFPEHPLLETHKRFVGEIRYGPWEKPVPKHKGEEKTKESGLSASLHRGAGSRSRWRLRSQRLRSTGKANGFHRCQPAPAEGLQGGAGPGPCDRSMPGACVSRIPDEFGGRHVRVRGHSRLAVIYGRPVYRSRRIIEEGGLGEVCLYVHRIPSLFSIPRKRHRISTDSSFQEQRSSVINCPILAYRLLGVGEIVRC